MKNKYKYNPWPLGKIPIHLQRSEPNDIKNIGYDWEDPRDIVDLFEKEVSNFAGSKYAVSVDCASNGLFLCLKYLKAFGDIIIPNRTYCSVPQQIIHAGCNPILEEIKWSGVYQLKPYPIYDAAVRWKKDMYKEYGGSLFVVSFQIKKSIPIGKMGVILTDDINAYNKLKLMSYDGRDLKTKYDDINHIKCIGYHMYATPEDCARGLFLMKNIDREGDIANSESYPDLTKWMHKFKNDI